MNSAALKIKRNMHLYPYKEGRVKTTKKEYPSYIKSFLWNLFQVVIYSGIALFIISSPKLLYMSLLKSQFFAIDSIDIRGISKI
ncbi:MAG: hypothetical protein ABIN58_00005, partial [candidate division WOR-3 bacterium]